jgi:hypothetical protein
MGRGFGCLCHAPAAIIGKVAKIRPDKMKSKNMFLTSFACSLIVVRFVFGRFEILLSLFL